MPSESMINSQVEFSDNDLFVFDEEENEGSDREIGLDEISDWKMSKSHSKEAIWESVKEIIKERVVFIEVEKKSPEKKEIVILENNNQYKPTSKRVDKEKKWSSAFKIENPDFESKEIETQTNDI